jgi:hypothetical protein
MAIQFTENPQSQGGLRFTATDRTTSLRISTNTSATFGVSVGARTFLGLFDTPDSYSGQTLKVVRVNAGETALEFTDPSAGSGDVTSSANITDHAIVRGDGGAKGVQDSGILIDDDDKIITPVGDARFFEIPTTATGAGSNFAYLINVNALTNGPIGEPNYDNDVVAWGHNVSDTTGVRLDTNKSSIFLALENRFFQNGEFGSEFHLNATDVDGNNKRPISVFAPQEATDTGASLAIEINSIPITNWAGDLKVQFNLEGTATIALFEATHLEFQENDQFIAIQRNTDDTDFLPLPYIGFDDNIVIGPSRLAGAMNVDNFQILSESDDVSVRRDDASTNTIIDTFEIIRTTSGAQANGLGSRTKFIVGEPGDDISLAHFEVYFTDVTAASEDANFDLYTIGAGSPVLGLRFNSAGASIPTTLTLANTGLHLLDTNASHDLIIAPGSNLTDDRTLTVTTGDANVILDLTAVTDEHVLAYDLATNTWRGVAGGAGAGISNVVEDLTPQLGGDLDANTFDILFDSTTGIRDESDNEQLIFVTTASAVNYWQMTNSAAGGVQRLEAAGGDAAIAITIASKSTDPINFEINGNIEASLTATAFSPGADGGNSLGTTALGWQNLFGNTGFVANIENGDWVATHTAGILTVGTGDLRVTTVGTNDASVVTRAGTATLTNKTIDANGTGNSISNIETPDIAAATLVTAADTIATNDNDTTWPTTAAIIDYAQPLDADLTSWAGVTRAAGFDTFAATPTSANLDSLVTDDTGSGALVFANTPTLVTPLLGTPTSGVLTNCTGLPTILAANEATDTSCFLAFFTAATGELGPKTNANLTLNSNTGVVTFASAVLTTADINGGTVDGAVIGGASAAAGTFTTLAGTTIELGAAQTDTTLSRVSAGVAAIEGSNILTEGTAEAFLETAIDTLANLTSIQGFTVTFADAGFDVLSGWDDSASAHKNLLLADILTEASPAAGDFVVIYGAEGDVRKVNWSGLPGAGGGISNVVEDTSPTLGGDLEGGSFSIGTVASPITNVHMNDGSNLSWTDGALINSAADSPLIIRSCDNSAVVIRNEDDDQPRIQISLSTDTQGRINFGLDSSDVPGLAFGDGTNARDAFMQREAAGVIAVRPTDFASTATVENIFTLRRTSSGSPANGIGVSLALDVETTAGNIERGATISAIVTDVTSTSEDFDCVISTMAAGAGLHPLETHRQPRSAVLGLQLKPSKKPALRSM